MNNTQQNVVLDRNNTFTTAKLVEYLNANSPYKGKKTGEPFNTNDIQQYIRRKKLPSYVGGHPIVQIEDDNIGLKLIQVDFASKASRNKLK